MQSAECDKSRVHFSLFILHSAFECAPGQDCTDTERGLSPLPLPWATGAEMMLALKTREPAVRARASLSPGRDPQRPISAQTNWCRVTISTNLSVQSGAPHLHAERKMQSAECAETAFILHFAFYALHLNGTPGRDLTCNLAVRSRPL